MYKPLQTNITRSLMKRIGLQFFAEDEPESADDTETVDNESSAQDQNESTVMDYEELFKTDKNLKSFIDKHVSKATRTAVENDRIKQRKLADDKLSEAEKLRGMSDREQAEYFKAKMELMEQSATRQRNAEALKSQTVSMFNEKKLPLDFVEIFFDFEKLTADDIKSVVDRMSDYEYYKAGEFENEQKRRLDEALKQKSPETHNNSKSSIDDKKLREQFGLF